jgi:uncharacterized protein (TIGR02217 family)
MATVPVLQPMYGFSIMKKPVFASIVQSFKSGREVINAQQTTPLFEFELKYETLKDQTQNQTPYQPNAGFTALEQLSSLFLFCNGQYGRFVYEDLSDCSRTGQEIGVGDGVTTTFEIVETIADANTGLKFSFTVGKVNFNHSIVVYINGTPVPSAGNWEIDASTATQLVWAVAPSEGAVITMDFYFYYLCRFISDEQEFEQFMKNWWTAPIKFRSINTSIDLPVHGAHWVIFSLEGGNPIFIDGFTAIGGSSFVVGDAVDQTNSSLFDGTIWDLATLNISLQVQPPGINTVMDAVSIDTAGNVFVGTMGNELNNVQSYYYNGSVNTLQDGNVGPTVAFVRGPQGVSPDGTIAVGTKLDVADGSSAKPCYWVLSGTNVPFTALPTLSPSSFAACVAIGSDNDTIVGDDDPTGGDNGFAVKWSISGGTETVLAGPAGYVGAGAVGISSDLTVVVGLYNFGTDTQHPCYWTGPTLTTLPTTNTGTFRRWEQATGISNSKEVICGSVTRAQGGAQAVVWRNGVIEVLPDFAPGFNASSFGRSISADGNTVSGTCTVNGLGNSCVWKYITF